MQIRCTLKLLAELGANTSDLYEIEKSGTLLGNWYANIFTLDRRKTLIFMNERTLLSFIIIGIIKDNIKNFPIVFINGIERILTMLDIDDAVIEKVLSEHMVIDLTRTGSKKLLGNMNELVSLYKHFVFHDGGLKHTDLFEVIAAINSFPQRNLGWQSPTETVKAIFATEKH